MFNYIKRWSKLYKEMKKKPYVLHIEAWEILKNLYDIAEWLELLRPKKKSDKFSNIYPVLLGCVSVHTCKH